MSVIEHNKIAALSDAELVKFLGNQIKNLRLNKNISQQELAAFTGLERSTISKFENGRAASLLTFVQILRGLKKLDWLDSLKEAAQLSPLQIAKLEGRKRKRASGKSADSTEANRGGAEW